MKKSAIILAAAIVLAACNKTETSVPTSDTNTLYAQIEQDTATKTYMDANNNIRWSSGDQIVGFMKSSLGLQYQILQACVGKTSASFENISGSNGNINAGTEWNHNIVYYPYSDAIEAEKTGPNYSLSVVLPAEQTYEEESFGNGAMAMVAVSEDNNITFKNVLGGMKLQLKGTQKVASITLQGKNSEKLSGAATVTAYTDDTKPAITMASGASKTITLNCGGIQLKESTATEFIIALPPVLFSQGFTVTVTDSDSQTYTVETDKNNEVLRSTLLVMPSVSLIASQEGDYIDEYGVNHGQGVKIGETVWAPVNCGYHETDFKYGKLYQWGRKYGQGGTADISSPIFALAPDVIEEAQSKDYEGTFFTDWSDHFLSDLWNSGTEEDPVKTIYDPCPPGWRVPTSSELEQLLPTSGFEQKVEDGEFFPLVEMRDLSGEILSALGAYNTSKFNIDKCMNCYYLVGMDYVAAIYEWVETEYGGYSVLVTPAYYIYDYSVLVLPSLGSGAYVRCVQVTD